MRNLYSWLLGRRVGQLRYRKGTPFLSGWSIHRYRVDMYEWSGWRWQYLSTQSVTEAELTLLEVV